DALAELRPEGEEGLVLAPPAFAGGGGRGPAGGGGGGGGGGRAGRVGPGGGARRRRGGRRAADRDVRPVRAAPSRPCLVPARCYGRLLRRRSAPAAGGSPRSGAAPSALRADR